MKVEENGAGQAKITILGDHDGCLMRLSFDLEMLQGLTVRFRHLLDRAQITVTHLDGRIGLHDNHWKLEYLPRFMTVFQSHGLVARWLIFWLHSFQCFLFGYHLFDFGRLILVHN